MVWVLGSSPRMTTVGGYVFENIMQINFKKLIPTFPTHIILISLIPHANDGTRVPNVSLGGSRKALGMHADASS
jgi:hypothetical protein